MGNLSQISVRANHQHEVSGPGSLSHPHSRLPHLCRPTVQEEQEKRSSVFLHLHQDCLRLHQHPVFCDGVVSDNLCCQEAKDPGRSGEVLDSGLLGEEDFDSHREARFLLYWGTTTTTATSYTATSTLGSLECTPSAFSLSIC